MEMEKEISETAQRGDTAPENSVSSNHIPSSPASPPPLPFVDYAGIVAHRPSELEIGTMMSHLRHSGLLTDLHDHQDLVDRRHAVLSRLEEITKEARASSEENLSLKMVNAGLTKLLSLLLRATSDCTASVEFSGLDSGSGLDMSSWIHGLGNMLLGDGAKEDRSNRGDCVQGDGESPCLDAVVDSSLHPDEGSENAEANRVSLPKIISVRSDRKLKTVQSVGVQKQRVYVPGQEKKKQSFQMEVYNQGMFKTELCNKWQETGACPYGKKCRFAHGIKGLRPVLRHPRYKTEVCRMLLNGGHCPYGQRCHFRHTLADDEKLIRPINTKDLKPFN